ncbi:mesoderm induction early response protein 1 [Diachasma alloeum]|uniref:mesoderm induction early response protein 1 n=1 Tax=Diachasma alloeum TaxID=454923 RepID=UPI0007381838|nr:mesoderm induction early response protein 1 [Diachasma alloeum]
MLQDSRSSRTTGGGSAASAGGERTLTRRMTGNGCARRSERNYNIGPTSDLIVNDFDDERTLDEEEAMEGSEDSHNELSNLQKEGDMPLKELLAKYYGRTSSDSNSSDRLPLAREEDPDPVLQSSEKIENEGEEFEDEEEEEYEDDDSQPSLRQFYTELVKEKEAERLVTTEKSSGGVAPRMEAPREGIPVNNPAGADVEINNENNPALVVDEDINYEDEEDDDDSEDSESTGVPGATVPGVSDTAGVGGTGSGGGGSSRLLRSVSRPQSEEEDDDCDYSPDEEEWKKTIMVGSDYQATIPEGLCRYDDALPYENEDKILWNPSFIPETETEEFLERAQLPNNKSSSLPVGAHVRDDEQALYLLLQCGYNLEEALRRRRMNVLPPIDAISLWSEEECHNFESGLRTYGKDFHLIQKNKV